MTKFQLSEEQETAAERLGQDVCLVAGPGSGKTRVLTERFSWLVESQNVAPDRILAITFTEKATNEIRARLVERFLGNPERRRSIERAYVSTIHGFCARILQENALAAGVDVGFGVLDELASGPLLREAAEATLNSLAANSPELARQVIEAIHVSTSPFGHHADLADSLISLHEQQRIDGLPVTVTRHNGDGPCLRELVEAVASVIRCESGWSTENRCQKRAALEAWIADATLVAEQEDCLPQFQALAELKIDLQGIQKDASGPLKDIRDRLAPGVLRALAIRHYAPIRDHLIWLLEQFGRRYAERKAALFRLDFADLETRALTLLRTDAGLRSRVQDQFDYILMDELQDTNPVQWEIINLIRRPDRFFAVGDINQSIYGFRHANPELFREYRGALEKAGHKVDKLRDNYRTRAGILHTVDWLICSQPGIEPPEFAPKFTPRKVAAPIAGPPVEFLLACGESSGAAEEVEAKWIARRIRDLIAGDSVAPQDIAVLGRKINVLLPIEIALRELGVPCDISGGKTLYQTREVRDLIHLLCVLANPRDTLSLAGVLRSPLVGLRDESLYRLKLAGGLQVAIWEPDKLSDRGFEDEDRGRLIWFGDRVREAREVRNELSPERLLAPILDDAGYRQGLAAQARANVEKFLAGLRDRHHSNSVPLAETVTELRRFRAEAAEAEAPPANAGDAVQLMSMHKAKGLEFRAVFLVALQKQAGSDRFPLRLSREHGIGVRWKNPVTGDAIPDTAMEAAKAGEQLKCAMEEWRLLYVAATRAEEKLVLSMARSQGRNPAKSPWSEHIAGLLSTDNAVADEVRHLEVAGAEVRLMHVSEAPEPVNPQTAGTQQQTVTILHPPELHEQYDSGVSVTRLSEFLTCPRKYYLGTYLGFDVPEDTGSLENPDEEFDPREEERRSPSGAEFGSQVHDLLAGLPVDKPMPEAVQLVARFRESDFEKRVAAARVKEREFDFALELEGLVVRGQIDLWFEEQGRITLADYKTDRFDPDEEPERLRPYKLQLALYAMALEKMTGKLPVESALCMLRRGTIVPVAVDGEALRNASTALREFKQAQQRLDFPLRESGHCRHCKFYQLFCPAGHGELPR